MEIQLTLAQPTEATSLANFIRSVYDDSVALHYTQQGNDEFYKYITPEAIEEHLKTNHWILKAEGDDGLLGIIEIRDNKHLSMLFISSFHQRQGIGKQLLSVAIKKAKELNPSLEKMSVHSSPNSVVAYEKLGFKALTEEQVVNGIRFTTMEKLIT